MNSFVFKDSCSFIQFPLSVLAEDYLQNGGTYEILKSSSLCQTNNSFDQRKYEICRLKLDFPHEKFDNTDEMKQQKKPPQKPDYDSTLTESGISDEAFQNVNKFWEIYEIPNLLEYGESFFTKIFS